MHVGKWASRVAQMVKNPPAMGETWVRSLGWEDSPREGNGYPLQYSGLEKSTDRGAWQATVHGVARSQERTEQFSFSNACLNIKIGSFKRQK